MNGKKNIDSLVITLAVLGSLVLINILGTGIFTRADMTRNQEFTLSQASVDTVRGLKDPVTVRAYFSKNLPSQLASTARYIKDILDEYYAQGRGNFRYEFIDPTSEETEADKQKKKEVRKDIFGRMMREKTSVERELEALGIRSFQIQVNEADKIEQKRIYMGVAVMYGDQKEAIPMVTRTDNFEYELTTLIRKVSREKAPKVALVTGHQGPDFQQDMRATHETLMQMYDVTTVDLTGGSDIADDVDAILVVGPKTPFSVEEKKKIDRFIMSGRSAAFLLGPVSPDMTTLQASENNHGLTDMLHSYGVKIEPGVVLDTDCATISVTQQRGYMRISQPVRYPFILAPRTLSDDHPLTRRLSQVTFPFSAPLILDAVSKEGYQADVLVTSSLQSWVMNSPYNLDPFHRWTAEEVGAMNSKNILVTVSGSIPSHFAGEKDWQAEAENARVLVSGGHAFVQDRFMSKGNQALVLNMMDWLVMDEALLAVRSRGLDAAPLEELSDGTRTFVKYANIVGLPLAFVAFGLIRWRLRESRRKNIKV